MILMMLMMIIILRGIKMAERLLSQNNSQASNINRMSSKKKTTKKYLYVWFRSFAKPTTLHYTFKHFLLCFLILGPSTSDVCMQYVEERRMGMHKYASTGVITTCLPLAFKTAIVVYFVGAGSLLLLSVYIILCQR